MESFPWSGRFSCGVCLPDATGYNRYFREWPVYIGHNELRIKGSNYFSREESGIRCDKS